MTSHQVKLTKAARIGGKRIEAGNIVEVDAVVYGQLQYHKAAELIQTLSNHTEAVDADVIDVPAEETTVDTDVTDTPSDPATPIRALDSYTRQDIIELNAKEQRELIEQHDIAIERYKSLKAPELEQALLEALNLDGELL